MKLSDKEIIYCDNHLLIVIKPAGMSTQPHDGEDIHRVIQKFEFGKDSAQNLSQAKPMPKQRLCKHRCDAGRSQSLGCWHSQNQLSNHEVYNLQDLAKAWIKKEFQKPGNVFLEPIHRLDKPVSGLVLFARTSKALSRLQEMMRGRQIEKTYYAWVEGVLPQKEGTLEHFLMHGDHHAYVHPKGKLARLHYRQIAQEHGKTHVEIILETGRYHQIRAQFLEIGCPIVGDAKYGSKTLGRIALHHGRLRFNHPVTHKQLDFHSQIAIFRCNNDNLIYSKSNLQKRT